ncbi:MAG: hypothetical protein ACTSRS_18330 [Candidatus Helarchaeota archaeon]
MTLISLLFNVNILIFKKLNGFSIELKNDFYSSSDITKLANSVDPLADPISGNTTILDGASDIYNGSYPTFTIYEDNTTYYINITFQTAPDQGPHDHVIEDTYTYTVYFNQTQFGVTYWSDQDYYTLPMFNGKNLYKLQPLQLVGDNCNWSINGNTWNWEIPKNLFSSPPLDVFVTAVRQTPASEAAQDICPNSGGIPISAPLIHLVSPVNKVYNQSSVPIKMSNSSEVSQSWYRISNNGGNTWSQNYSMIYINNYWVNSSTLFWNDGNYTLQLFANNSGDYLSFLNENFTIDYSPIISLLFPKNNTYNIKTCGITVSNGSLLNSVWYRYNSGIGWSNNKTLMWNGSLYVNASNLIWNDGIYHIQIFANDSTGDITQVDNWFSINTIPPIVVINSPQNITYEINSISINLSSTATDVDTYWYRLYNISLSDWLDPNNRTWTGIEQRILSEGQYIIYAWANDTAGNIQNRSIYKYFTINSPPTVSIIAPLNYTYTTNTIGINLFTLDPDIDKMWFRIQNKTGWITGNITWSPGKSIILPEGIYMIFAWGNDSLGLISLSANVTFTIDITGPEIVILSPLNITYITNQIPINISCSSSDLDTIWYRIFDGNKWITGNKTWTENIYENLEQGVYWLYVWANDTNGNEICVNISFTIQTTIPRGQNTFIPILIITIGAVGSIVIIYKFKKSRKKKKGVKGKLIPL